MIDNFLQLSFLFFCNEGRESTLLRKGHCIMNSCNRHRAQTKTNANWILVIHTMRRQQSVLTNDDLCVFLNSFLPSLHLLCTLHSVKCKTGPLWTPWVTTISFHFRWILCDLPWHGFRHLPPCSRCEVQRSHSGHYKCQLIRSVA